jgi:hypothetical protein
MSQIERIRSVYLRDDPLTLAGGVRAVVASPRRPVKRAASLAGAPTFVSLGPIGARIGAGHPSGRAEGRDS